MNDAARPLVLLLVLLPAAVLGAEDRKDDSRKLKLPVEDIRKVVVPGYDADTGELLWEFAAAKVAPDTQNPRLLRGTDVRIAVHHKGKPHVATAKKGSVDTTTNEVTLEGDVAITFGDEQSTRVEADRLTWKAEEGTASTKSPVTIVRKDMAIEGVGLRLWLSDSTAPNAKADRTDTLIILERVRVVVQPRTRTWLLSAKEAPRSKAKAEPKPIVITCTGSLTVFRSELTATFRDNVRAVQGDQCVTCDLLTLAFRPSKEDKNEPVLDTVTATGHVRIDDAQTIVLADAVLWSREQGSVKIIGRPAEIRWDNGNRIKGGLIQRLGEGSEVLCSVTPDHPHGVYLLAYSSDGRLGEPDEGRSSGLRAREILDWLGLCVKLSKPRAGAAPSVGGRIWELLPQDARAAVEDAAQGKPLETAHKAELLKALNAILTRRDFYRQKEFEAVPVPTEAKSLLRLAPEGMSKKQVRSLNRLLLEAAFPQEIAKSPE